MNTPLGDKLRKIRKEHNDTLSRLAEKLGVSTALLSHIETGKREAPRSLIEKFIEIYELRGQDAQDLEAMLAESYRRNTSGDLGKVLQHIRKENKDTLITLSRKLSVDPTYISQIEKGVKDIPRGWFERLAAIYNLSGEDVASFERMNDSAMNRMNISNSCEVNFRVKKYNASVELGKMFQDLRKAHNDTQEELAVKLGTYAAQISRLESASRNPLRWLKKLRDVYDIDDSELARFEMLAKSQPKTFTLNINITNIDQESVSQIKELVGDFLSSASPETEEPA